MICEKHTLAIIFKKIEDAHIHVASVSSKSYVGRKSDGDKIFGKFYCKDY